MKYLNFCVFIILFNIGISTNENLINIAIDNIKNFKSRSFDTIDSTIISKTNEFNKIKEKTYADIKSIKLILPELNIVSINDMYKNIINNKYKLKNILHIFKNYLEDIKNYKDYLNREFNNLYNLINIAVDTDENITFITTAQLFYSIETNNVVNSITNLIQEYSTLENEMGILESIVEQLGHDISFIDMPRAKQDNYALLLNKYSEASNINFEIFKSASDNNLAMFSTVFSNLKKNEKDLY